ncbi:MAG: GNAT family N-acetyltransferase [Saprospiraceae bacterium]|nr:GNAT family N-acetyltransferase [Saprospiraceae bacterium]
MVAKIDCRIRPMLMTDVPQAMLLVEAAHWNQTEKDWWIFLNTPGINLIVEFEHQVIASITSIDYHEFVWIAMVLVHPEFRRKGIASMMMDAMLQSYPDRNLGLDATPQGAKVYEHFGFRAVHHLTRWRWNKTDTIMPEPTTRPDDENIQKSNWTFFDQKVFGADRTMILQWLSSEYPDRINALDDHNFILGRQGRTASQIGPLTAESESKAYRLFTSQWITHYREPLIVDAFDQSSWNAMLEHAGFEAERKFIRMQRGGTLSWGIPENQFAIAGPELG